MRRDLFLCTWIQWYMKGALEKLLEQITMLFLLKLIYVEFYLLKSKVLPISVLFAYLFFHVLGIEPGVGGLPLELALSIF